MEPVQRAAKSVYPVHKCIKVKCKKKVRNTDKEFFPLGVSLELAGGQKCIKIQ
jgi:hypothetical protein